jgi:hypothetical protein
VPHESVRYVCPRKITIGLSGFRTEPPESWEERVATITRQRPASFYNSGVLREAVLGFSRANVGLAPCDMPTVLDEVNSAVCDPGRDCVSIR